MSEHDKPTDPAAAALADVRASIDRAFAEGGFPATETEQGARAPAPQGPPPDAARLMIGAFHRVIEGMAIRKQASAFAGWRDRRRARPRR